MQFQAKLAAGASLLACFALPSAAAPWQESAVREVEGSEGTLKESFEVRLDDTGQEIRHGKYEAWYSNEELAAQGEYADGARTGSWKFYFENGKRKEFGRFADGRRTGKWKLYHETGGMRGSGRYEDDRMHGPWEFRTPAGKDDPIATGDYRYLVLHYPDQLQRGQGYLKDGRLFGPWVYYWEDGDVQFAGRYVDGRREGAWIFHHADGTYDEDMLSGLYEKGVRRGLAPAPELPDFAEPLVRPTNGEVHATNETSEYDDLQRLLDLAAKGRGERREEAFATLATMRAKAVPLILERLQTADHANPREVVQAIRAYGGILKAICNGASYPFEHPSGDADGESLELATKRWTSLWALTQGTDFWEIDAALIDPENPETLFVPPFPELDAGSGRWFAGGDAEHLYGARFDQRDDDDVARSLKTALEWLSSQQGDDGGWDADAFAEDAKIKGVERMAYHDVGVSALAVLAYMAAGNSSREGPFRENVARGIAWIASKMQADGSLESLLPESELTYDQALAALALCEASAHTPSPMLVEKARTAVEWILGARNPGAAWRYGSTPTGENDSSVTAWMVQVLFAAKRASLGIDEQSIDQALADAKTWIETVSERRSGRVGYDAKGSRSVRVPQNEHYPREKSESLTAAGLFCHALFGTNPREEIIPRHVYRIRKAPPRWSQDGLTCDMYYWYFAVHALHQFGGEAWESWWKQWREIALRAQRKKGEARGSWEPIGPWGFIGGRVYSTAIMVLGLTVPQRLPRLVATGEKRSRG